MWYLFGLLLYEVIGWVVLNKIVIYRPSNSRGRFEKDNSLWPDVLCIQFWPLFLLERTFPLQAEYIRSSRPLQAKIFVWVASILTTLILLNFREWQWLVIIPTGIFAYVFIGAAAYNMVFSDEDFEEDFFDDGAFGLLEKIAWVLMWPNEIRKVSKTLAEIPRM